MSEPWIDILDEGSKQRGMWLGEVGVRETVGPLDAADSIMSRLEERGFAVLGGDIWRRSKAGCFTFAHAVWTCEIQRSDTWGSYVARSCERARQYLMAVPGQSEHWVTAVASNKPTASQLAVSYERYTAAPCDGVEGRRAAHERQALGPREGRWQDKRARQDDHNRAEGRNNRASENVLRDPPDYR